jgi:D-xylose reductase
MFSWAVEHQPQAEPAVHSDTVQDNDQPADSTITDSQPAVSQIEAADDSAAVSAEPAVATAAAEEPAVTQPEPEPEPEQADGSDESAESSAAEPVKPTTAASRPRRTAKKKKPAKARQSRGTRKSSGNSAPQPAVARKRKPNTQTPKINYSELMEHIDLKWGARLPKLGFGFWKVEQDQTADVCYSAIDVGYRHLDCACDYGNEVEVGQGIAKAIKDGLCDREDLWVTSKLWNTYHAAEHVLPACEKSLQDLGLDYLDLYLIHFPIAQRYVPIEKRYPPGWFFDPDAANPVIEEARVPVSETWQAMEELAKSGLVRNIGICNFGTSQIRDLLTYASIRPAVLQVETHPYLTQEKLLRYCQQERIAYTAFSPLGAQSYFSLGMADPSEAVMQHPVVSQIAEAVGKTVAQVLLRWGVQRGTSVIPKTSSRERMIENINVFDFELTDDQMQAISALDQGRRFNDPGDFGEAAFNTFLPIYE